MSLTEVDLREAIDRLLAEPLKPELYIVHPDDAIEMERLITVWPAIDERIKGTKGTQ